MAVERKNTEKNDAKRRNTKAEYEMNGKNFIFYLKNFVLSEFSNEREKIFIKKIVFSSFISFSS